MNGLIYKVNGEILKKNETEKFIAFYECLRKNSKYSRIVYRGENYSNLKRKLNLLGDNNYDKLSQIVFLIGEKGRAYREECKNEIKKKYKIYSIDYLENDIFNKIFDKLNFILSKKSYKPEIEYFNSVNTEFAEYFKDKNHNKKDFISKINTIENKNEKTRVRDYYLSLLHQIGKNGFYYNSFFLSTSTKFNEAKKFTKNSENSSKIIFVSWINYPINYTGITYNYLNLSKNRISQKSLPIYDKTFFPKQEEISIKGGLLPHFILGYIRIEEKIFEINPNLFSNKKNIKNTIKNGFEINQTDFSISLDKTDYNGFFILNNNNEYSDFNI